MMMMMMMMMMMLMLMMLTTMTSYLVPGVVHECHAVELDEARQLLRHRTERKVRRLPGTAIGQTGDRDVSGSPS
jgi:hypothetical protein